MSGDKDKEKSGSGQTLSFPVLDSIVSVRSPAKPSEDEGTDSVYLELQELLDEPFPSGSKENFKNSSGSVSKVGMNAEKVKKTGSGS